VVPAKAYSANADGTDAAGPYASPTYNEGLWLKTSYKDPVNITISSLKETLEWTNTSFYPGSKAWASDYRFCPKAGDPLWFGADDCTTVEHARQWYGFSRDWNYVQHNVKETFHNNDFADLVYNNLGTAGWALCGFTLSDEAHFRHDLGIRGLIDQPPKAVIYTHDHTWGACTNLVDHYTYYGWFNP
jgi:hypothetical protein